MLEINELHMAAADHISTCGGQLNEKCKELELMHASFRV
jgi:hypothetical protein